MFVETRIVIESDHAGPIPLLLNRSFQAFDMSLNPLIKIDLTA